MRAPVMIIVEMVRQDSFQMCNRVGYYPVSAVPDANRGEKLPRPAYAPHLHPVGDAAPAIRLFAMIGLILTMVFPRSLLKSKFNISTQF